MQLGVEGSTVIRCTVREDGHYEHCAVLQETPKGFGFGQAAIRMTCLLTAAQGADGKFTGVGGTEDQHIVFKPPRRVCDKGRPNGSGYSVTCTFVWPDEEPSSGTPAPTN